MQKLKANNISAHMSGSGSTIYFLDNLSTNYKKVLDDSEFECVYLKKHLVKSADNDCL